MSQEVEVEKVCEELVYNYPRPCFSMEQDCLVCVPPLMARNCT